MKKITILIILIFLSNSCFSQAIRVAIMDFDNISGKEEYNTFGKVISNMLITDLKNNVNELEIFERTQLNKILNEQQIQSTINFDAKTAVQIGKLSGVNFIFIGSIFVLNDQCNLSCKLIDVKTSKILISKDVNGKIDSLLHLKSELAKIIAQELKRPYNLNFKDQLVNKSIFTQYGQVLNFLDKGKIDVAEELCKEYSKNSNDFIYFNNLSTDIENIKKQLNKNTKDIEILKSSGGKIIDATSLEDLNYNLYLETTKYEEKKSILIKLLKQDLNTLTENNIYISDLRQFPSTDIALWSIGWAKALQLRNKDLNFCDSIAKSLYMHPKSENYQDPYQLNKETAIIYLFAKLLTEIKETKSYKTSEIKSNDLETLSKYNNLNNLSKSKISNILNSLNWAISDNEMPMNKFDQQYFEKNIEQFKRIMSSYFVIEKQDSKIFSMEFLWDFYDQIYN
jgi:TolB-like protein